MRVHANKSTKCECTQIFWNKHKLSKTVATSGTTVFLNFSWSWYWWVELRIKISSVWGTAEHVLIITIMTKIVPDHSRGLQRFSLFLCIVLASKLKSKIMMYGQGYMVT